MPILGKFPRKVNKEIPASIDFNATAGDNTLHLRNQTGGYDCTIYWGDGLSTKAPVNGGNVIHSYATAKVYNILIKGKSFAGFYVNNQTGKEKYVAVYSMGKWENDTATNFSFCFYGCSNLTTILEGLFRYNTAVTSFQFCFSNCASLTTIPADLFRYNTAVTSFQFCFYNCTSLTTIPADLFRYNMAVTSFDSCFYNCSNLTIRNDIFGTDYSNRFNGKVVSFEATFKRNYFTGTQGSAPQLWSFTILSAIKIECFAGSGNSTTSLSNYNSIPSGWK